MTARRGEYPRAHKEQQGRQERGQDGQGQGSDEGSRRCPNRRQEQEEGRPLGPEEGQSQGEEGRRQGPLELAPAARTPKRSEGSGPRRGPPFATHSRSCRRSGLLGSSR